MTPIHFKKTIRQALVLLALAFAGSMAHAGTITYYHNHLAGSPVAATNESGQVIWRESYRPYGERLTNSAAAAGNDVWFTSRRQDSESGLVYMGARYYDPVAGRFVSTDPVLFDEKNVQSFNRYAYANNNPYKYVDPDGRNPLVFWLARTTGAGYAVGVLADAAGQYAAWGSVDWGLALRSSAAKAGAEAGMTSPAPGMSFGLTVEKLGGEATALIATKQAAASSESGLAFKTQHYASRLEKAGIQISDAESAVAKDVAAMRNNMEVNADVVGRIRVGNTDVEYRARLLNDGSINVGTIFPVE